MNDLCEKCDRTIDGSCTSYTVDGVGLHVRRGYCVLGGVALPGREACLGIEKHAPKMRAGQQKQTKGEKK